MTNFEVSCHREMHIDEEWDELAITSGASSIFMTSKWLTAWSETLGKDVPLAAIRVRVEGVLVAAGAFANYSGYIQFAGKGATDYSEILLHKELSSTNSTRCINIILETLFEVYDKFHSFQFSRIPQYARCLNTFEECQYLCDIEEQIVAPNMAMVAAPDALRKKSLRRHHKSLAKLGDLRIQTVSTANEIRPLLNEFFELHIKRWQATQTPSVFVSDNHRRFFLKLTGYADSSNWLRFTEVRLDGYLIAAHFGFLVDKRFIWYKPCYDPDYAKHSPGEVMLKHLIETSLHEEATIFDFTLGNEKFKLRFATDLPVLKRVYLTDSHSQILTRRLKRSLKRHMPWVRAN